MGAKGTILMVDDEPVLRAIVGRILTGAGYDVVDAEDGEQALALYAKQGPFSMVLLDESMPGLSGHIVLERIRDLDPTARVILFTGDQPEESVMAKGVELLEKPVSTETLLLFVSRALARPTGQVDCPSVIERVP